MSIPHIPVSWGELIDKITILEIKRDRLTQAEALAHVRAELDALQAVCDARLPAPVTGLKARLAEINARLWDIEDRIREHERAGRFDAAFIADARAIYRTNDARAALKREINTALGSTLVEEKSYAAY